MPGWCVMVGSFGFRWGDGEPLALERLACWQMPYSSDRWAITATVDGDGWIELVESGLDRRDACVEADIGGSIWRDADYLANEEPFVLSADGLTGESTLFAESEDGERNEVQLVVDVAC